jgi:hypothetical protein
MNVCDNCGQDFASVTAYEKHRVGVHAYEASADRPDGRRCRTEPELIELGMTRDSRSRWRLPTRGKPPWTSDVNPVCLEAA